MAKWSSKHNFPVDSPSPPTRCVSRKIWHNHPSQPHNELFWSARPPTPPKNLRGPDDLNYCHVSYISTLTLFSLELTIFCSQFIHSQLNSMVQLLPSMEQSRSVQTFSVSTWIKKSGYIAPLGYITVSFFFFFFLCGVHH